jgi:hypothetical protein
MASGTAASDRSNNAAREPVRDTTTGHLKPFGQRGATVADTVGAAHQAA